MVMVATLCCGALALMGAVPLQDERPPQPVFPEFISGTVTVQGSPAPAGAQLVACIDDCDTVYQSEPKTLAEGGRFERLELDPGDDSLINRDVTFYLVNEFGRIKAQEVRPFIGVLGRYRVALTFLNPLPAPTAPPPSPTPTETPTPTDTPVPTPTPAPTDTPVPTLTPTPTPVPTATAVIPPTPTTPPTPTALLPATGDPTVAQIPKLLLIAGAIAVALGAAILLAARLRRG